ncbi:hypothetical protein DFH11DRAFT_1544928 [Phellopilus nigrolimitatus]|nr:hypothetical protein DFH11DRAFT_1544928 [Phellopilus nigrolimitatus]
MFLMGSVGDNVREGMLVIVVGFCVLLVVEEHLTPILGFFGGQMGSKALYAALFVQYFARMWVLVSRKFSISFFGGQTVKKYVKLSIVDAEICGDGYRSNKPVDVGSGNSLNVSHGPEFCQHVGISAPEELCGDGDSLRLHSVDVELEANGKIVEEAAWVLCLAHCVIAFDPNFWLCWGLNEVDVSNVGISVPEELCGDGAGELEANEWFSVPIEKSNKPVDVGRGNLLIVSHGSSVLMGRRPPFFFSAAAVDRLLNHAAQLTAAQAPSQLVLLLSSALADAGTLRRELTVAQSRATRAERLLASVQGLSFQRSPWPKCGRKEGQWRERNGEGRDCGVQSPREHCEGRPDAEARANRAECLCTQFIVVKRYEHACSLRSADARTAFARLLSTASHVPVAYPSYPTATSTESPQFQHEHRNDALNMPSLPLPHAIGAPQLAHRTRRTSRAICVIHFPAILPHMSRGGRVPEGLLNGECEKDFDGKRRRTASEFARLPGNTLGGPPATSMSIPISMRRRAAAAAAGPSSITTTPFPVNNAVPCQGAPAPESASLSVNPGLNVFSAEEQATICSFLSAVGMSEAEALADDGVGYSAALDADIEAHIAMSERRRVVERMWAGSGRCWIESRRWSVTSPHNFGRIFSSPALRLVLAVGSVGSYLKTYEECDTFLSTDAGLHWKMVSKEANKYEFGDQGSIMVLIHDEDGVDETKLTESASRKSLKLQYRIHARALTTVPDSMLQKFMLVGQLARKDQTGSGRFVVIFLDFASTRSRQCTDSDFEKWYARSGDKTSALWGIGSGSLMRGGTSSTTRLSTSDYNFIRNGDQCLPAGPEPIPGDVCRDASGTYMGSSGYRLIPGNTCNQSRGIVKDAKGQKDCSLAQLEEGVVTHQTFEFASEIVQYAYFKESTTILVRLHDGTVWQSRNKGYTWIQLFPNEHFIVFYLHSYSNDRAYILTSSQKYYYTTDVGRSWKPLYAPLLPNTFGAVIMHFHPISDYLIWTGNADCEGSAEKCRAEARYSTDNGRNWRFVEEYVRNCAWARDAELKIDATQIICESYKEKKGNQRLFQANANPLQLVGGTQFFSKKKVLFDRVVGFAKFSEFLIVAEYLQERQSLDLQVLLDGKNFATGVFPPTLRPQDHESPLRNPAYTILESSTKSVFMHLTTSEFPSPYWGVIMKSNGNGTYFGISADNVNRNDRGFVDSEKMIVLDGIALINVVTNTESAAITRRKELSSWITHNVGGFWKPLTPPKTYSLGQRMHKPSSASIFLHALNLPNDLRHAPFKFTVILSALTLARLTAVPPSPASSWSWEMSARRSRHTRRATDEGITWREYTTRVDGSYFWATTGGGAGAAGSNPAAGVRDRRAHARTSPSRATRDALVVDSSSGADTSEDDMVLW